MPRPRLKQDNDNVITISAMKISKNNYPELFAFLKSVDSSSINDRLRMLATLGAVHLTQLGINRTIDDFKESATNIQNFKIKKVVKQSQELNDEVTENNEDNVTTDQEEIVNNKTNAETNIKSLNEPLNSAVSTSKKEEQLNSVELGNLF